MFWVLKHTGRYGTYHIDLYDTSIGTDFGGHSLTKPWYVFLADPNSVQFVSVRDVLYHIVLHQ